MTDEQLVARIQSGEDVGENMLALYLQVKPFLHYLAAKYQGLEEVEDLEQEAYLGLYAAVDDYEPERGVSFLAFAGVYMKNQIRRYLTNYGSILKLSPCCRENLMEYRRFCENFQKKYGRAPTEKEAACGLDISRKQVRKIREYEALGRIGSLDSPVKGLDEEGLTVMDTVAAAQDTEGEVLDRVEQEELKALLWPMVDSLPDKLPTVLRRRYQEGKTLKEIGRKYSVTIEMVRQLEKKGLRELRKPKNARKLRPFLPEAERCYSMALCGGLQSFRRTWMSSTERAALKELEASENSL